jgi:hypothetical protein
MCHPVAHKSIAEHPVPLGFGPLLPLLVQFGFVVRSGAGKTPV